MPFDQEILAAIKEMMAQQGALPEEAMYSGETNDNPGQNDTLGLPGQEFSADTRLRELLGNAPIPYLPLLPGGHNDNRPGAPQPLPPVPPRRL